MSYDRVLIRYGEISTKGRNRNHFISKMKQNIQNVLRNVGNVKVHSNRERMIVYLNETPFEPVKDKLSTIFGIQSFSPVVRTEQNMEEMKEESLTLMKEQFKDGKTFKVSTRRSDKQFEFDTNDINHAIGGHILKNIPGIKVNVKQPDIELLVEVRKEGVFLSCEKYEGMGGLPVGTSGKAMLLLSGGIDSPVASYLMMKRGVEIEAVHFYSPPYTSERAKQKVIDLARILTSFGGSIKLHIVPFTELQKTIYEQIPENYTMTSTRRMMLLIADEIRRRNNGLALITGESLGQVASQTMESMLAINDVTSTPILRPLVAMDKLAIIDIAKEIGTFETSILPYEDCCTIFTPPSPKTKPKLEKVQHYESFVDYTPLIEKAVEETETIYISSKEQDPVDEFADLF
ncbi:thiamine biosynthesis protein ThiI [Oikeobacillus pervagus]|uniref:Probable tRNA sulfurtransferase n=1 Tax=Oikeobacillus pervagus TaxID=1325931 RepID=A0AAJ1SYA9_9BACI|nr:tRNA uracil 4-sulfurtransferase ThiI [Oikeobacillus pervagus]MDQ0215014.1 thiamine biosynthesis protein ThiI [Oikeobacillus pervagus]